MDVESLSRLPGLCNHVRPLLYAGRRVPFITAGLVDALALECVSACVCVCLCV
jgi:hypothetical protein